MNEQYSSGTFGADDRLDAGTENVSGGELDHESPMEDAGPLSDGEERIRQGGMSVAEGAELLQMQRIRQLDLEQLEVEEVDDDVEDLASDGDSSIDGRGDGGAGARGGFTFDTCLASLHTYLGEVDDVAQTGSFLNGGALLTLPMFYLEGIVLFPEDTLPLRVLQPRFKAAVELAMRQTDAPCTLGVIHVRTRSRGLDGPMASVGTTAEIRQLRRLSDGSMNVVTRGCQRFRVVRSWIAGDAAPCAQVQIIEEDRPLHIPRDAFGMLASVPRLLSGRVPRATFDTQDISDEETEQLNSSDGEQFDDDGSDWEDRGSRVEHFHDYGWVRAGDRGMGEDESSEEEETWWLPRLRRAERNRSRQIQQARERRREIQAFPRHQESGSSVAPMDHGDPLAVRNLANKKAKLQSTWGGACKAWAADESKWMYKAQMTAWPHWVYRMYDAYDLARRAADMLRQLAELPKMEEMVRSPSMLSFFIASNMPLHDATRQELLEVDGVVDRLRREIRLLESMNRLRCKSCSSVIAKRSDIIVMSANGPINAYVNPEGHVHETLTLSKALGLMLRGVPETAHSWFPGYAWTIAYCRHCELHMGWRFTAVKKAMQPRAFWGVRRSQLAEDSS